MELLYIERRAIKDDKFRHEKLVKVMDSFNRAGECLFAAAGGFFAFVGATMLFLQILWGEWPFNVEGQQKPLGVEFAGVFFTFGQMFLFFGSAKATSQPNRRGLFYYLALGNGVLALGLFGALFLPVALDFDWSLTWPPLLGVWLAMVVLGVGLEYRRFTSRADDQTSFMN